MSDAGFLRGLGKLYDMAMQGAQVDSVDPHAACRERERRLRGALAWAFGEHIKFNVDHQGNPCEDCDTFLAALAEHAGRKEVRE